MYDTHGHLHLTLVPDASDEPKLGLNRGGQSLAPGRAKEALPYYTQATPPSLLLGQ